MSMGFIFHITVDIIRRFFLKYSCMREPDFLPMKCCFDRTFLSTQAPATLTDIIRYRDTIFIPEWNAVFILDGLRGIKVSRP
ncbi:hypothetical protein KLQU111869_20165 [Klebsiella quasipneumoniae subsp. similipneumoniae]